MPGTNGRASDAPGALVLITKTTTGAAIGPPPEPAEDGLPFWGFLLSPTMDLIKNDYDSNLPDIVWSGMATKKQRGAFLFWSREANLDAALMMGMEWKSAEAFAEEKVAELRAEVQARYGA